MTQPEPETTDQTEVARLHDEVLAGKAEISKLRDLLGKENQRANDAITREETAEQAAEEAQQDVHRLALMVDEYGAGASALTDKLKRVRDRHRETCILAKGQVPPTAFTCGLCEVLDAPAAAVLPAPVDRAAVLREVADRYQGFIDTADTGADPRYWTGIRDMVLGLRRIADETPTPSAVVVRRATDETQHVGGNAEDCPACSGTNPDYPFICPGPAGGAQQPKEAHAPATVAYQSTGGRLLRCLAHAPEWLLILNGDFHPVTSEDLPDGGVCTFPVSSDERCGVDVLIPQQPKGA